MDKARRISEIIVLIDSREQRPLPLPNSRIATLKTGDYSVEGLDNVVAVERKNLSDLLMCIGQERDRFERCLERLAKIPHPAIVIEASMADVLAGTRFSKVHPSAAIGSVISWSVKYRIPVWLAGDRRAAAATVMKILTKAIEYNAVSDLSS